MTTLNARANQAYREWGIEMDGQPADSERAVFEDAWETGYKAHASDMSEALKRILQLTPASRVPDAVLSLMDQLRPDAAEHGQTGCPDPEWTPEAFTQEEADLIGVAVREFADKHGIPLPEEDEGCKGEGRGTGR